MSTIIVPSNFSIIALRIFPECRVSVRKCLKSNEFYYLNTNFEISYDGKSIYPREGFVMPIGDSFFRLDEWNYDRQKDTDPSPSVNISAIVGMNGDGKSSLVEFMIRLLNNFACRKNMNPYGDLSYVKGVCGEMYYQLDRRLFRIKIDKWNRTYFNDFSFDEEKKFYCIGKPLTEFNPDESVFYTLVSNYSHFAYNTEEFNEERSSEQGDDLWIRNVFHKNDAYQSPLNIHPYRDKGNIDINRERELSIQRLLISIAASLRKNGKDVSESGIAINGKRPYELRLRDIGMSKLQDTTLRKYFIHNRNSNILNGEIERLKESVRQQNRPTDFNQVIGDYCGTAMSFLSKYYLSSQFMRFADKAIHWLESLSLLNERSDIKEMLDTIKMLNAERPIVEGNVRKDYIHGSYMSENHMTKWRKIEKLSALQFLRLALVFDVCRMWNKGAIKSRDGEIKLAFDPTAIFKKYEDMSYSDKARHYLVYKTIEIFYTYPSYKQNLKVYDTAQSFFFFRELYDDFKTLGHLAGLFGRLSEDWNRQSHITLKLRQTYRYLTGQRSSRSLYSCGGSNSENSIVFDSLPDSRIEILSDIETLPPPIFKWEILYRKDLDDRLIPFHSFSSGEKQRLFFTGAVIYHLQNISSIGAERIHYHSVNLIFEEIELYFHPEWQRTLISDLLDAIRSANIPNIHSLNMIFVTHSPYILSDVPKSNVLFLKDGRPNYDMQENTFGANINSLLKNGFFLPSIPMGKFAKNKINTLFEILHKGNFDPHAINNLYAEIMTVGEPAIRMQLMTLLAPYRRLILTDEEVIELFDRRLKIENNDTYPSSQP